MVEEKSEEIKIKNKKKLLYCVYIVVGEKRKKRGVCYQLNERLERKCHVEERKKKQ